MKSNFKIAIILSLLGLNIATAQEAGYSLLHQKTRSLEAESARGFEGRINFGGGQTDRYSGDRWSLGIGYVKERNTIVDDWVPIPSRATLWESAANNGFGRTDSLPAYSYINFAHRWYTVKGRFNFAPQLRFFIGTGVAWRNVETCVAATSRGPKEYCWNGTAYVSTPWAFHQTLGFKWRERLELAYEHDSTGGISEINKGDDIFRLTLYVFKE